MQVLLQRFDIFTRFFANIKSLINKGNIINMATYKTVIAIQEGLNYRVDRLLIQEPFILEDAIGRITPVHLQFINSWEAFDSVLTARFHGLPGVEKIMRKEFVLQERATHREITRTQPWESAFRPGQLVDMSMVFNRTTKAEPEKNKCPYCWVESEDACTKEITW